MAGRSGGAPETVLEGETGRVVDGRLRNSNRALAKLLGPDADLSPGHSLAQSLPALGPLLALELERLPATGEPRIFEQALETGTRSLEVTGYRPGPEQFVCLFRDASGGRLPGPPG